MNLIAEMYKRRERLGYIFLGLIILIMIGWLIFQTPGTTKEWLEMLFFLFPLGLVLSIIIISHSHYKKVENVDIPHSEQQLHDLDHIVIKKDVDVVPRLLLFEKDGKFIGILKPVKIRWWAYPVCMFNESVLVLLPITYVFLSHDEQIQFTFQKNGWFKHVKLTIFDEEDQLIGTYIQEELKSLFQIQGQLLNEKEELILSIKASGFSGNFRWEDEDGNQWAYFYNGKFPHEYTDIFRDTYNHIVELSDRISNQNKTRLLAVIGYLFMARVK